MKKKLLLAVACIVLVFNDIDSQTVSSFESLPLDSMNAYWNGSDFSGGFSSGNAFFENTYIEGDWWIFWAGWAFSNLQDSITSGLLNQYSAKTGSGYNGLGKYAICYIDGFTYPNVKIDLIGDASGGVVEGFYITNSTFAYNSMRDGDAYAKKFGGETGDDPDFFKLTIKAYYEGQQKQDSVNFYLADFRFDDNSQDYILKTWEWVDLTSLGDVDSLQFELFSSDNSEWGMNTPAYFCVDNFTTRDEPSGISRVELPAEVEIFPNPAVDFVNIDLSFFGGEEVLVSVFDCNGSNILNKKTIGAKSMRLDLQGLDDKIYFVKILSESGVVIIEKIVVL